MPACSRVSAFIGSGGGPCFASDESKVRVKSGCANCVSDFEMVVSVICDPSVGVSFSSIGVRKAGPGRENSFADEDAEFVCPNEFTQQAISRQEESRFIMSTRARRLRSTPSRISRTAASDTSDILVVVAFKVSHGGPRLIPCVRWVLTLNFELRGRARITSACPSRSASRLTPARATAPCSAIRSNIPLRPPCRMRALLRWD